MNMNYEFLDIKSRMNRWKNWKKILSIDVFELIKRKEKKEDFNLLPLPSEDNKTNKVAEYREQANGNLLYKNYYICVDGKIYANGYSR